MKTNNAVIGAIVACFVTIVVCSTVVFAVDHEAAGGFLTPLLGFAGTTIALVAGLTTINRKQAEQQAQLDEVQRTANYLANGGTDAKVRAGLADALKPELLKDDPETKAQLEADRAYRDAGPGGPAGASDNTTPPGQS